MFNEEENTPQSLRKMQCCSPKKQAEHFEMLPLIWESTQNLSIAGVTPARYVKKLKEKKRYAA